MDADTLFLVCNLAVLPAWALLAVAPGWSGTARVVHAMFVPLAFGVVYAFSLVTAGPAPEGAGFGSLRGVMAFFTVPGAALAGWIHYLVFDLFVGAWEVRDARRRGIRHAYVVPSLLMTFLVGPIGLALYLVLRWQMTNASTLEETA